ncbi:MAG TPA: hypothetical protein PLP01_17275 [Phycisphaerae bacterium]|nr:hypothetical protein [Phycisphaerae bacterium]HOI57007.1 hypothetical protein [Phycisphaerae bacterium]
MVDLMREACEWLGECREAEMSRPVIYARGTLAMAVDATGVRSEELTDSAGETVLVDYGAREWLIAASALAAYGEPQAGDRISDAAAGEEYEVLSPSSGMKPWRWSGVPGVTLRIHTKQVQARA